MSLLAAVTVLCSLGLAEVEGRVLDESGRPIPGARVFMEQGLGGAIEETRADTEGAFRFADVLPKPTGFFAIAPGFGFGGRFHVVRLDEQLSGFDLTLFKSASVSGVIKDGSGKPVEGANIGHVALLLTSSLQTSVPFFKLQDRGFPLPLSDAQGRFTIPHMPAGKDIALKVGHPSHAWTVVRDVPVGGTRLDIRLEPGVVVSGVVASGESGNPVPDAPVLFSELRPVGSSANPATFAAISGFDGRYSIRLRPGPYAVRVEGAQYQTAGMPVIEVAPEPAAQQFSVRVTGKGRIEGRVSDAQSETPVSGARLLLESAGSPVAIVSTGPAGTYAFDAASGESVVRLLSAPGFLNPSDRGFRLLVKAGETKSLPTIWLAPIPDYSLYVTDAGEEAVAGAFVTVIEPRQLGWRMSDDEGKVALDFAHLPEHGRVAGWVEAPRAPLAAVFSIDRNNPSNNALELLPLVETRGVVKDERGTPLAGVVVEAILLDEESRGRGTLWSTVTDGNGEYRWESSAPYTPQGIVAYGTRSDGTPLQARSLPFVIEKVGGYAVPDIELTGAVSRETLLGTTFRWRPFSRVTSAVREPHGGAYLVLFGRAVNAEALYETAQNATHRLQNRDIEVRVILDEPSSTTAPEGVHVFIGPQGTPASTLLIDGDGKVALETAGMPPIALLNRVAPPIE